MPCTPAHKWRKVVRLSPRMNRNRHNQVFYEELPQAREQRWCRGPNHIDHGPHIGARPFRITLPLRYDFMQIKDWLVVPETDLIKERNIAPELFPNIGLVVSPHRENEVGSLDQLLSELSLHMCRGISTLLSQPALNPRWHRLRPGIDTG